MCIGSESVGILFALYLHRSQKAQVSLTTIWSNVEYFPKFVIDKIVKLDLEEWMFILSLRINQ